MLTQLLLAALTRHISPTWADTAAWSLTTSNKYAGGQLAVFLNQAGKRI